MSHPALRKRFALFLLGCVPVRLALVYLVAAERVGLKMMAFFGGCIALGFATIFAGGLRRTGLETGGAPIWWNWLRPVHALLWGLFAYFAWIGRSSVAWKLLFVDICVGTISFFIYHGMQCNLQKMLYH